MRNLEQLTRYVSEREVELQARARATLEAANEIDELVAEVEATWAKHALFSERDNGTRPDSPDLPASAFGLGATAEERELGAHCAKLVTARSLARALFAGPPSAQALERLSDLLHFASWEEFLATAGAMAGEPEVDAWAKAMRSPDYECYVAGALERERDAVRKASERWRTCPKVLGQPPGYGHTPIRDAFATALSILRQLDAEVWFEALRLAPLRAEVELAVAAVARRPDELLQMLEQAPVAVDAYGNETGHVAAILLAEKAWRYPVEVGGVLESRIRAAAGAARDAAKDDYAVFEKNEIQPWLDQVWVVLQARSDGRELSLALAVRRLAARTRDARGRSSDIARTVAEDLEDRVSAVYRPQLEKLAALLDGGDLGRHYGGLERWHAFARIACDDVGDIAEGAHAAWNRLVELLTGGDEPISLRLPEHLSSDTWCFAGAALAQQPRPTEALICIFDDLLLEREQARMGVRDNRSGSDLPLSPVRSRVAVLAGAHALVQQPVGDAPASMCRAAFAILREMWLGDANDEQDYSLVQQTYFFGALAYSRLPSGTPAARALHEELVDALRYLAPDPRLSCEVAALWLEANWAVEAVVEAFAQAGIDVHSVCASLIEEPNAWRSGSADLEFLAQTLGTKNFRSDE